MGKRTVTVESYHALAVKRGFSWIGGDLPHTSHAKTRWRCQQGHEWEAKYNALYNGNGCPICSHQMPMSIADYHELASISGLQWIGDSLPKQIRFTTEWRCENGHIWRTPFCVVARSKRCGLCYSNARKSKAEFHSLATDRGFVWIGTEDSPLAHAPTLWRCQHGHDWTASYHNIKSGGSGCPYCTGYYQRQLSDYQSLAAVRDFEFIGEVPQYVHDKAAWRCAQGHEWLGDYSTIASGHGCPFCARKLVGDKLRIYPNKSTRIRAANHKRRTRKLGNGGAHTAHDIDLQLRSQKDKKGRLRCWWCSKAIRAGDKYHVDHRIPLSRGGSNAAENLCIACPDCNQSKYNKLPSEFNGRLL